MTNEHVGKLHRIRAETALDIYTRNPEKTHYLQIACSEIHQAESLGLDMVEQRELYERLRANSES